MSLLLAAIEPSLDFNTQQLKTELQVVNQIPSSKAKRGTNSEFVTQQFKKGQSGNPTGRPRGFAELRHGILDFYNKDPKRAIRRLYNERIDLFFAYAFGKPADRVELSGPDGGAIEVQQSSQVQLVAQMVERGLKLPGME